MSNPQFHLFCFTNLETHYEAIYHIIVNFKQYIYVD